MLFPCTVRNWCHHRSRSRRASIPQVAAMRGHGRARHLVRLDRIAEVGKRLHARRGRMVAHRRLRVRHAAGSARRATIVRLVPSFPTAHHVEAPRCFARVASRRLCQSQLAITRRQRLPRRRAGRGRSSVIEASSVKMGPHLAAVTARPSQLDGTAPALVYPNRWPSPSATTDPGARLPATTKL